MQIQKVTLLVGDPGHGKDLPKVRAGSLKDQCSQGDQCLNIIDITAISHLQCSEPLSLLCRLIQVLTWCKSVESNIRQERRRSTCSPIIMIALYVKPFTIALEKSHDIFHVQNLCLRHHKINDDNKDDRQGRTCYGPLLLQGSCGGCPLS